jgi:hypothetical protein
VIPRSLAALLALCAVACGNQATGPSPSPATLSFLTLSPQASVILIGRPLQLTANGVFSDGSARQVDATFLADDSRRASVSAAGLVSPHQPGRVSITATAEGKSAILTFTVLPDFSGQWEGTGRLTACTGPPDACANALAFPTAGVAAFVDQIDQQIRALIVLTGNSYRAQTWADGRITDEGQMVMAGESRTDVLPNRFIIQRVEWRSSLSAAGSITGSATASTENRVVSPPVTMQVSVAFDDLRRSRAGSQQMR